LPADGLQQAKDYAQILDLKFAYATNGDGIIEHDFITGQETALTAFPSPEELWQRLQPTLNLPQPAQQQRFLTPAYTVIGKPLRYYQEIAINRALRAILAGQARILLTMATGTGKTDVAFHIAWKLWSTQWNRAGLPRRPRILFLADRAILVDDPKDKRFIPFGDARHKIAGEAVLSREMYFATYQSLAEDQRRPGLYRDFPPDFFDLIIVDECHRGSAADESNWRTILDHFTRATQLGMTATPLREDNRDTYAYFGSPVYTYSLRQGIDDGFLAPYRVHRILTNVDATGWRPTVEQLDALGNPIPDQLYQTPDFERRLVIAERTKAIAQHLADFLRSADPFAKTIVFCVDQEHADAMRRELNNACADLAQQYPDYVVRIVSDEGDIGRGHLSNFQELERATPVIVTTSKLLTTGVDAPTVKNIAIVNTINSMTEFKQIIGRGTRVRADYGKLWFSILDYTGSATRLFADPDFDGDPIDRPTETTVDQPIPPLADDPRADDDPTTADPTAKDPTPGATPVFWPPDDPARPIAKYYVDGETVQIAVDVVQTLDANGRLRLLKLTDYTAEKVRHLYTSAADLRARWSNSRTRREIIAALQERGITLDDLADAAHQPDADPLDLLCYIAYHTPLRTRRERAEHLRRQRPDFWGLYQPAARAVLEAILDKYVEHGVEQLQVPAILHVPPLPKHGNVMEIIHKFGSADRLRAAFDDLQAQLYAEAA
jgi:type I restriction enzyme R subunit